MASNTYYPETKYKTRLSRACTATDSTLYVDSLPTESTGILMLDKDSDTNYEIILYAAKSGAGTTASPYVLTGCVRGLGANGTSLSAGTGKSHGRVEIGSVDLHYFSALLKLHVDSTQVMPAVATLSALPLTGNTQYDLRFVEAETSWYYWSIAATSGLITDWVMLSIATISNATETTTGKVELGTPTDSIAKSATGDSGGPLAMQPKYCTRIHDVYTPAYLTGGTGATAVVATWNAVTDGTFAITINGTARSVTGLNFSAAANMAGVATVIQTGIRALTASTETVVWSTDHFVVSSVLTTSSSAITVTSAAGSGTDISGAGGTAFMDSDTGHGTVTDKVLNKAYYSGYTPILNALGEFDDNFMSATLYANMVKRSEVDAKGDLLAATADNTLGRLAVGTNDQYLVAASGETTGLKWRTERTRKLGVDNWQVTANGQTKEITHNLGVVPRWIKINYACGDAGFAAIANGQLTYDGTTHYLRYTGEGGGAAAPTGLTSTTYAIVMDSSGGTDDWRATITTNGINSFILTSANYNATKQAFFSWEVIE